MSKKSHAGGQTMSHNTGHVTDLHWQLSTETLRLSPIPGNPFTHSVSLVLSPGH